MLQQTGSKIFTLNPKSTLPEWMEENRLKVNGEALENQEIYSFLKSIDTPLLYAKGHFWKYDAHGVWRQVEDEEITSIIFHALKGQTKKVYLQDMVFLLKQQLRAKHDFAFDPDKYLLNFKNCVLDTRTLEIKQHNFEHYKRIQIPYDYTPDAICPKWFKFLESLEFSDPNTLHRLQEWAGYLLEPTIPIQKALFIKGDGANGKSLFLEILSAMLGEGNVSSLDPKDLTQKFKIFQLNGKLANISTDVDVKARLPESFKQLVRGESFQFEEKFKLPYSFRPSCKVLISSNGFMPTSDVSHGFFRSFDILEFLKVIPLHEQDPMLKNKLLEELPGIFNWALKGLIRLRDNDWKMIQSNDFDHGAINFKMALNPIEVFISDCTEISTESCIETEIFRTAFRGWCTKNGYKTPPENRLGQQMKALGFAKVQRRVEGRPRYFYCGIKML